MVPLRPQPILHPCTQGSFKSGEKKKACFAQTDPKWHNKQHKAAPWAGCRRQRGAPGTRPKHIFSLKNYWFFSGKRKKEKKKIWELLGWKQPLCLVKKLALGTAAWGIIPIKHIQKKSTRKAFIDKHHSKKKKKRQILSPNGIFATTKKKVSKEN